MVFSKSSVILVIRSFLGPFRVSTMNFNSPVRLVSLLESAPSSPKMASNAASIDGSTINLSEKCDTIASSFSPCLSIPTPGMVIAITSVTTSTTESAFALSLLYFSENSMRSFAAASVAPSPNFSSSCLTIYSPPSLSIVFWITLPPTSATFSPIFLPTCPPPGLTLPMTSPIAPPIGVNAFSAASPIVPPATSPATFLVVSDVMPSFAASDSLPGFVSISLPFAAVDFSSLALLI